MAGTSPAPDSLMTVRLVVLVLVAVAVGVAAVWWRWRASADRHRGAEGLPRLPAEWRGHDPTWVVWTAPTCASCRGLLDLLARRAPEMAVQAVDVTEEPEGAENYSIRSTPTTLVATADGRVTHRLVGVDAARRHLEETVRSEGSRAPRTSR
ncbi:MAG: thioredoxin family protein [Acidimicrobiia bacterium]|nr:thioredoxin family protein [Acidimicrobiia bacterium]